MPDEQQQSYLGDRQDQRPYGFLASVGAAANPFYGGQEPPRAAFDFNLFGGGGNPLLDILGNVGVSHAMGQAGLVPSQMFATQNFYDQQRAKQYYLDQQFAMSTAAQADRSTYVSMVRGVMRMTKGRALTFEEERAAQGFAGGIAGAAPILAQMFPETFDALHGVRGSAAVMSLGIQRGGRTAQDPVTGLTELSGASAGAMAGEIQRRFFGPEADISAFKGLSMGKLGMLYESLQQRGYAGPSLAVDAPAKQMDRMVGDREFLARQLGMVREKDAKLHATLLDQFDANRPGAAADQAARNAGAEALSALRASDPELFRQLSRRATAPRGVASLPAERQIAELLAAPVSAQEQHPVATALEQLPADAATTLLTAHEGRTGQAIAQKTVAEQRAALAADPESARLALTALRDSDRPAFDALLAGRAATQRTVGALAPADRVEELAQSHTAVTAALDRLAQVRPDIYQQMEQEGKIDAIKAGIKPAASIKDLSVGDQDRVLATSEDAMRKAIAEIDRAAPEIGADIKRNFDAKKIGDRLQNLSGAVAAMRDIFGDAGKPNAPMRELIEGLNQLTQGGLATQSPAQLEQSVRLTQGLARSTGMGMDAMMGLMARGAGLADSMGLDRQFVMSATQGAAAFGQAVGQVGAGATPHFQAASPDKMALLDQQLRLQAAHSGMANQLNVALRLSDTMEAAGKPLTGPAAALAEALRQHQTEFVRAPGAEKETVFMPEAEFRALMDKSGVDLGTLGQFYRQRPTNLQYGAKYDTGALVRDNAQRADIARIAAQTHQTGILAVLGEHHIDGDQAQALAANAAQEVAKTLTTMDPTTRRNDAQRNQLVADAVAAALPGVDLSPEQRMHIAEGGWGAFDQYIRTNQATRAYGAGLPAFELNDPKITQRGTAIVQEQRIAGAMRSALAGVGQGGLVATFMDQLQRGDHKDFASFLGAALGGVAPGEINAAVAQIRELTPEQARTSGFGDDKNRLTLMTERLAQVTAGFDKAKALPPGAERERATRESAAEAGALVHGGGEAQKFLIGLLGATDYKEAQLLLAGALGAGGMLGGKPLTPEQRARIAAAAQAAEKGIAQTAADAGVAVGGTFGAAQTREILAAGARLDHRAAQAPADRTRNAADYAAALQAHMATLMASPEQIAGWGAGALKTVEQLRVDQLALQSLADKQEGGDVGKLLAGGDAAAQALRISIDKGLTDIQRRQTTPGKRMGTEEKEAVTQFGVEQRLTDPERNQELVSRLLKETGGKSVDVTKLAAQLGEGKGADTARGALTAAMKARHDLDALVTDTQLTPEQRAAVAGGDLSALGGGSEREYGEFLFEKAGSVMRLGRDSALQGTTERDFSRVLDEFKGTAGDATDDKTTMKLIGRVTLDGGDLLFTDVRADPVGAGSTPV
jgi:hypothetical protein